MVPGCRREWERPTGVLSDLLFAVLGGGCGVLVAETVNGWDEEVWETE